MVLGSTQKQGVLIIKPTHAVSSWKVLRKGILVGFIIMECWWKSEVAQ